MSSIMSFQDLKKNRKNLRKQIESAVQADGKKSGGDEDKRFWYPKQDEKGAASTLIRFLPPATGNNLPWAKRFRHAFKGPGGWFIENCPTSIGKDCPVCNANKDLWNTDIEANRKIASERKRKQEYFYNILVLEDEDQPESVGVNKLFKTGPYIFKMIQGAQNPEFKDEQAIDAFDMWEGANFRFKMFKEDKQLTYKKSSFQEPSELCAGDEAQQETIYNGMFDLSSFTEEKLFKSFEDLQKQFDRTTGASTRKASKMKAEDMQTGKSADAKESSPSTEATTDGESPFNDDNQSADTDDDALAMFQNLANGE